MTDRARHPSGSSVGRTMACALAALPPQKNVGTAPHPKAISQNRGCRRAGGNYGDSAFNRRHLNTTIILHGSPRPRRHSRSSASRHETRQRRARTYSTRPTMGCIAISPPSIAGRPATQVWAWCLMPNLVHLVLVPADADGLRAGARRGASPLCRLRQRAHARYRDACFTLPCRGRVDRRSSRSKRRQAGWGLRRHRQHEHPSALSPYPTRFARLPPPQAGEGKSNRHSDIATLSLTSVAISATNHQSRSRKGRRPGDAGWRSECGARGRRLVTSAPGRLGHQPAGTMTGTRGASLQPGPALAGGTPPLIGAKSREAWPEAEPWGCVSSFGESRGGTPEGVLPPPVPGGGSGGGSAAPPPCPPPRAGEDKVGVRRLEIRVCRRSASFSFFSFLAFLSWLAEHDRAEGRSHRRLKA